MPGLPVHEYVYGTISETRSAQSLTALLIEQRLPTPSGQPRERIKVFQLAQSSLAVDHCSLSRVALVLHENGEWTLSMRADQNPWMTGPNRDVSTSRQLLGAVSALDAPIPRIRPFTEDLKRNQFIVRVRCYGAYPLRETLPLQAPGKPVLLTLPVAMFWVQRGHPYDFFARQSMPEVTRAFDLIDRVEVELSYR